MKRSMKKALLFLFIMLLSFIQAAERKAESKHFTLIFSEESENTAAYLFSRMEECYDELVSFFGADPCLNLPVYIREDENSFNAYFTPFPSNHIVLYNTHVPEDLMFGPDTIRLVFLHELTHAFTFSFRGALGSITSAVFGDGADLANYLHFLYFLQEGISVYTESRNGNGRLSDPFMLSHITEAVAEGIDLSYMDASGGRDVKPYGELGYIYGGAFLKYAAQKYGEERIAEFFVRISKGVFSFPQNTWSDMFASTLWDEWKAFLKAVVPPEGIIRPSVVKGGMSRVTSLSSDGSEVYYTSPSDSALIRLSDGKTLRALPNGQYLSSSDEYLTLSYSDGELNYTLLMDHEGRKAGRFDSYHMGVHLNGSDRLLLVRSSDLYSFIDITDMKGNVLISIPLGKSEISSVTTSGHAIIDGNICFIDAGTGEITLYPVPEGVMIRYLSSADDVLSFSYVYSSDTWTLPRYGEFRNGAYTLYGTYFLGGVWNPVRLKDKVYFVSDFFDSASVSCESISSFGEGAGYESACELFISECNELTTPESAGYVPLLSVMRGTLFPLAYGTYGNKALAGPGLTWISTDMSEKLTLMTGGGWDFDNRWFMSLSAGYKDISASSTVNLKDGRTDFDIALSYSPSVSFGYGTRVLKASETVKYSGRSGGFSNVFSLSFSDKVKKGAQRYHVGGYSVSAGLYDLVPVLEARIYIPSLLPSQGDERLDFSLPAVLSAAAWPGAGKFTGGVNLCLMNAEIQKPVRFMSLYIVSFSVFGSGNFTTLMTGGYAYKLSLEASFLLSPVLGTMSALQWKLGARLSYDGNVSFSLVFTPL